VRRDLRLTTAICLPTEQVLRRIAVSQPSGCFPECYLTQCWFTPIGGEIYLIGLCPTSFLSSREGSSWLGIGTLPASVVWGSLRVSDFRFDSELDPVVRVACREAERRQSCVRDFVHVQPRGRCVEPFSCQSR
jgi:hypothetical protein